MVSPRSRSATTASTAWRADIGGTGLPHSVTPSRDRTLNVTTQSATKIHAMDANYALQTQEFVLDDGAYLEYLPDPVIPHRQARFASETRITVHPTASLVCSEIVQPGRTYW